MTRTKWLTVALTTGVGVWLWNRARGASAPAAVERGTVIFSNAPTPGPADDGV